MFERGGGFEIPCQSFERATRFYAALLGAGPERRDVLGVPHAVFAPSHGGDRAAIVQRTNQEPAPASACIHWGAATVEALRAAVERAWHAGGRVVMPVTAVGDRGFIAIVEDTEGNTIRLHAPLAA